MWVELSAVVAAAEAETLKVSGVEVTRIHGGYVPTPREERCLSENLAAIGGRRVSAEAMRALEEHLPTTEMILVEWPCAACSATDR
jgi:hypothetical protein